MARITKKTLTAANRATKIAVKDVKVKDSFQNFALNLGLGTDNALSGSTYGFNPITRNRTLLEWVHRGSWMGGVAVDVVAEDMTRAGIDIVCDSPPEDVDNIQQMLVALNVWPSITDVVKWSRLYGGSIGVMMVDGQDVSTPLDPDKVGKNQFRGILPMDRWMVEPSLNDLVTEQGPHIGLPKFYSTASNTSGYRFERIHYTRVLRMEGIRLPYWQRVSENLWGISVLERLYDRMVAFDSATTGVAQMAYKSHVRTYKLEGLRELIGEGGSALASLYQYVDMMRKFQGIEGITLIDAKDDVAVMPPANMTGMSEALLQFGQQLSGALQIPLVRLFGQSPAGLNSTGESDLRTYYDGIAQQQQSCLLVAMKSIVKMTALSLGTKLSDDFAVIFRPLWQLSEEQKSEVSSKDVQTILSAEERGIITQQQALKELKQQSKTTGRFSNITDEDVANASDELAPRGEEAIEQQQQVMGEGEGKSDETSNDPKEPKEPKSFKNSDELELSDYLDLDHNFGTRDKFVESEHPRGNSENSGQFSKGGGGSTGSSSSSSSSSNSGGNNSKMDVTGALSKAWGQKLEKASQISDPHKRFTALATLNANALSSALYSKVHLATKELLKELEQRKQEAYEVSSKIDREKEKQAASKPKVEKKKRPRNLKVESALESTGGFKDSDHTPEEKIEESHDFLESNPSYKKMGVTAEGLACVQTYVADGYKKVNKELRSGKKLGPDQKLYVDLVNDTLDKLPKHKGEVYRLAKLSPEQISQFKAGKMYKDSAFLSTSSFEGFLEGNTGEYEAASNTDIVIASKTGRNVAGLNENLSEGEVLFKSGTRFKVKSVKTGKRNKIVLEEVISGKDSLLDELWPLTTNPNGMSLTPVTPVPDRARDSLPVSQWMGMDIAIETLAGQIRHDAVQPADYGYIRRVPSAEGPEEWMDCYLSPARVPGDAYVVDGYTPEGAFDEHKVMLGYPDKDSALRAFHEAYNDGRRAGGITPMSIDRLRAWMASGDVTRPVSSKNLRLASNGGMAA